MLCSERRTCHLYRDGRITGLSGAELGANYLTGGLGLWEIIVAFELDVEGSLVLLVVGVALDLVLIGHAAATRILFIASMLGRRQVRRGRTSEARRSPGASPTSCASRA